MGGVIDVQAVVITAVSFVVTIVAVNCIANIWNKNHSPLNNRHSDEVWHLEIKYLLKLLTSAFLALLQ